MRTRRISNVTGPNYPLTRKDENTGMGSSSVSPFSTAYVGTESIMEDINQSNFRSLLEEGKCVMNPMKLTRRSRQAEENPIRVCGPTGPYNSKRTFSGDFAGYVAYGFPNRLSADLGPSKALSLIGAYAEMHETAICGGELIGTIGQTVEMLRRPFGSAQKLLKKMLRMIKSRRHQYYVRHRKLRKALRRSKAPKSEFDRIDAQLANELSRVGADVWLETRYGWLPVMYDTQAVIQMVHNTMAGLISKMRVARKSGGKVSDSDSYSGLVGCWLDEVIEPKATVLHSYSASVDSGVIYRVKPMSKAEQVFYDSGLDLSGMTHAAWELIPASFVLDWFVNVGEWLKAVTPRPHIMPIASWTTTVEEYETVVTGVEFKTYFGWTAPKWHYVTFPGGAEKRTVVERTVNNSLPSSPMVIGQRLSTVRQADAAALTIGSITQKLQAIIRS